jgi:uncharacterized membrane protein YfcA
VKMPSLDTAVVVVAGIALIAAFINGALGYGFSSLTVPVALVFYTNRILNPAVVVVEVLTNFYVLSINLSGVPAVWRRVAPILIGLLPGIAVGAFVLTLVQPGWIKLATYTIILPLILVQAAGWRRPIQSTWLVGLPFGTALGILYSVTTISGPPLAILFNNQGLVKNEFRAGLALVRVAESSVTAIVYYQLGLFIAESQNILSVFIPSVVVGIPLGAYFIRRLDAETFRRICMSFDAWVVGFGWASRAQAPPVAAVKGAPGQAADAASRTADSSGTPQPATTEPVPLSDPSGATARGSSQPPVLAGGAADATARKQAVASAKKEPARAHRTSSATASPPPAPRGGGSANRDAADREPAASAPSARKQALAQIMAALDRHRDQTAAETEGTHALALQDTPDDRRPRGQTPKAAAKPAAKRTDGADRRLSEQPLPRSADARPPAADTTPPVGQRHPLARPDQDATERNPWMARQNRSSSDEWAGWPPSDGDCDVVEPGLDPRRGYSPRLSFSPYGWFGGPYDRYASPYDWRGLAARY